MNIGSFEVLAALVILVSIGLLISIGYRWISMRLALGIAIAFCFIGMTVQQFYRGTESWGIVLCLGTFLFALTVPFLVCGYVLKKWFLSKNSEIPF
jgi:hypothetical protein